MSILSFSRGVSHNHRPFFESPYPAGRKITAGFTYLQRITKAASFDVWFPDALKRDLEARIADGQPLGAAQFPAQWAAVRQFELLHESGNHKIYDLDPGNLKRAMQDLSKSMRAGGYRVTVATVGCYQETSSGDELEILDRDLQERIAQMIHMLYLDQQSEEENMSNATKLAENKWDYRTDLPHVGMVLGARDLFQTINDDDVEKRKRTGKGGRQGGGVMSGLARRHRLARQFFKILNLLPQKHIVHDTAIGLQLPELIGENHWNYIASPDETLAAFNHVLCSLFDKFNGISLSRLHQRADATAEIKASTLHLRSYGHPLREQDTRFYRSASLALN
jgi:hypothetical protein